MNGYCQIKKYKHSCMKNILICICFLLLASCNKPANNTLVSSPPSLAVDSLFSWVKEYQSPYQVIIDIWFTSPSKGFYISYDGYIYQSNDSGHTWIKGAVPDAKDKYNLFFVNSQYGYAQGNTSVSITKDGGQTWNSKSFATISVNSIFFTSLSTGFSCDVDSGIYKTTDTCNTWKKVFQENTSGYGYYIYFLNADTGFVFSGAGNFYKTTDAGETWQQAAKEAAPANTLIPHEAPYHSLVFQNALTGYYTSVNGLLKTADGGVSWNVINPNAPTGNLGVNVVSFPGINTGYYYTGSIIYKTVDAGQTWQINCNVKKDLLNGLHFIDSTTGWGAGSYIYRLSK